MREWEWGVVEVVEVVEGGKHFDFIPLFVYLYASGMLP